MGCEKKTVTQENDHEVLGIISPFIPIGSGAHFVELWSFQGMKGKARLGDLYLYGGRQPTPRSGIRNSGPYYGVNSWFPLRRPAMKSLFLRGGRIGGVVDQP